MKVNGNHSRLKYAGLSEEEIVELKDLTRKNSKLVVYYKRILDSFLKERIDIDDKNWLIKRARLDGQQCLVETVNQIFKEEL